MTVRTRPRAWAFGMVVLAIGVLTGCASSKAPTSTATTVATTTTVAPTTAAPTTTTTTLAPLHSVAEALAFVKSIYDPYAGIGLNSPPRNLLGGCFIGERKCGLDPAHYVTPQLQQTLEAFARTQNADPVDCGQNTPARVAYDPPVRTDGSVTITVHTFYLASGDNPIKVTVDLSSLTLSNLVCPT